MELEHDVHNRGLADFQSHPVPNQFKMCNLQYIDIPSVDMYSTIPNCTTLEIKKPSILYSQPT